MGISIVNDITVEMTSLSLHFLSKNEENSKKTHENEYQVSNIKHMNIWSMSRNVGIFLFCCCCCKWYEITPHHSGYLILYLAKWYLLRLPYMIHMMETKSTEKYVGLQLIARGEKMRTEAERIRMIKVKMPAVWWFW